MTKSDITWAAIQLDISREVIKEMLDEVLALPDDMWYYNDFRGCYLLPVYNANGKMGRNLDRGNMQFTPAADLCTRLKQTIQDKIFPWMDPPGRVTILRTPAGHGLNTHFDVIEDQIGTLQEKFRLVLNGNVDKLWFYDENRDKVYIPQDYNSYVMDGGHPHSLDPGSEEKITLCVGAPWRGTRTKEYKELLSKSPYQMTISRPTSFDEEWLNPFWKK